MSNANSVRFSVNENDFTSSHSYRKFPLGYMPNLEDPDTIYDSQYIYVQAGEAIVAYQPYGVFGQETILNVGSYATATMRIARIVVPQFAMAPGEYGFVAYKGQCIANVGSAGNSPSNSYIYADQQILNRLAVQTGSPETILNQTYGFTLEATSAGVITEVKVCLLGKDGYIQ